MWDYIQTSVNHVTETLNKLDKDGIKPEHIKLINGAVYVYVYYYVEM